MRIWLNPQQLLARSLTPNDVINAIRQQNQEVAAGQIGTPPMATGQDFQLTVNVAGALNSVAGIRGHRRQDRHGRRRQPLDHARA